MVPASRPKLFNIANNVTLARLGLSVVFLILVAFPKPWVYWVAFGVFVLAGVGDVLDGYLARRLGLTSDVGRVGDPLVDKVLICGGFIMLLGTREFPALSHWMVLAVVLRELLVTTLRGLSEARGVPFMATVWGKVKMFLQSVALGTMVCAFALGAIGETWAHVLQLVVLYAAVVATVISGLYYVDRAYRLLRAGDRPGTGAP